MKDRLLIVEHRPNGKKVFLKRNYSLGVNGQLREHYKTKDVQFVHGSLNYGQSNQPMVFVVTTGEEQFTVKIYSRT